MLTDGRVPCVFVACSSNANRPSEPASTSAAAGEGAAGGSLLDGHKLTRYVFGDDLPMIATLRVRATDNACLVLVFA
jgi:hypothetical protein